MYRQTSGLLSRMVFWLSMLKKLFDFWVKVSLYHHKERSSDRFYNNPKYKPGKKKKKSHVVVFLPISQKSKSILGKYKILYFPELYFTFIML